MKTKIILWIGALLLLTAGAGCEKEKEEYGSTELYGTWKCIGFGDTTTGKVTPIEPADCEKCYVLTFKKDGTLEGRFCANDLQGQYAVNGEKLKFVNVGGITLVGEMGDCLLFYEALPVINSYEIVTNKLLLYYSNNKYLLFEHKNK